MRETRGKIKLENYIQDLLKNQKFLDHVDSLKNYFKHKKYKSQEENYWDYTEKLYTACSTYNIPPYPGRILIDHLIRGEKLELDIDVCRIKVLSQQDEFPPEIAAEYEVSYPVSIGISRYATIDDIKDYLEKNKNIIRRYLEEHQNAENIIKHYKRRNSVVSPRNDFIFENRYMDRKELLRLVNDKFRGPGLLTLGPGELNKIISREKKRRGLK